MINRVSIHLTDFSRENHLNPCSKKISYPVCKHSSNKYESTPKNTYADSSRKNDQRHSTRKNLASISNKMHHK
jgi:hypothetical protein